MTVAATRRTSRDAIDGELGERVVFQDWLLCGE